MAQDEKRKALETEKKHCGKCGKEIPPSVLKHQEGKDYAWHFCEICSKKTTK